MQYVGLNWEGTTLKVAILSSKGIIERLESFSEIPPELRQNKNLYITTGLPSDQVLRREVHLKLRNSSAILKALPFQIEALLPFESSETLVYPSFHPSAEGTDVTLFATSRPKVQHHIQTVGLDPDQVSCTPVALARFARLLFPEEPQIRWIHRETGIALEGDKIVFSQFFDDPARLEAYLDLKFSSYFRVRERSLQGHSYQTLVEFAVPIGLALEGLRSDSCQFRQKEKRQHQLLKRSSMALCLGLAGLTAVIGLIFLQSKEQKLKETVEKYFTAPQLPLEDKISLWQKHLVQETKATPLLADIPSVSEVLAWLGELKEPIEIMQFHYTVSGKVELEFKAAGPAAAQHLQETLQKNPTLVDTKQKIAWTAYQNFYKISFSLRKS